MTRRRSEAEVWAQDMFGSAALGDARRTARLVRVGARAAENPSGKLSEVFQVPRELDAAYDFVESDHTSVERLEAAVGQATASRCVGQPYAFVPLDGSSMSLTENDGDKGFGSVGTVGQGGRGIKVMTALAVDAQGTTIGVLAQVTWVRKNARKRSRKQKAKDNVRKATREKETQHWLDAIKLSAERLEKVGVLGWFNLDREGDAWPTLLELAKSGHRFTVRSAWDRVVEATGYDPQHLRALMATSKAIGSYAIEVSGNGNRAPRQAHMMMHAAEVTLRLRDKRTKKRFPLAVRVVWVHEQGTTPTGEKPLDWMLLTNAPIDSGENAAKVVLGYSFRWRVEEFHKTWKSGACNVELMQLRSRNAVVRWAIILAVVATRIERIKRLGRTQPERPASDVLKPIEIEVLIALKRIYKKRAEIIPDGMPAIGQAMVWLAEVGGYTGKSSGGPPGSITIGRGLERVRYGTKAVLAVRSAEK